MTAPSSDSRTTREQANPADEVLLAGQWFNNENCEVRGDKEVEEIQISDVGEAEIEVFVSEAVLIYL